MTSRKPGDKIVWVLGSNGVQAPKWLSTIQLRTDLEVLGEYVKGDRYFNDVNAQEHTSPEPKPKPKRAPAKKTPATKED